MAKTKSVKLPKMFRKPIPKKRFEKKILRRIYLAKERDFLLSLAKQDEQERYVISGELSKAEAKHLATLAKSIRKNRGLVTGWKAAILAVIIGSLLVFNFLFKDRLAEAGMEAALENVFRARAEAEGVHLSLFRGSLSFESLSVADRDKPMENLFELSRSELRVNIWELLKKRLVIERAVCSGIRLGTPRDSSGALPEAETTEAGFSPGDSSSSGLGALLAGFVFLDWLGLWGSLGVAVALNAAARRTERVVIVRVQLDASAGDAEHPRNPVGRQPNNALALIQRPLCDCLRAHVQTFQIG